jgi:hypothetical protein
MAVGDRKGLIVEEAIRNMTTLPQVCQFKSPRCDLLATTFPLIQKALELGTYCGYGSIRIALALPPQAKLITLEIQVGGPHTGRSAPRCSWVEVVARFPSPQISSVLACLSTWPA